MSEHLDTPAPKSRGRRLIATITASVLLLGAVGSGISYTVVKVRDADRTPEATTWRFPAAAESDSPAPKPASELERMLLPLPDDYRYGPDHELDGATVVLSGAKANVLAKEALKAVPLQERRSLEREIDKRRIKGMVERSYADSYGSEAEAVVVNIALVQMEDQRAVRDTARFRSALLKDTDVFRKGPAIKGHKDATCAVMPEAEEDEPARMLCSAHRGEVLVSVTAYGTKPLHTETVADLLARQLDRIEEPGEAV
ncbi:hypothetical protein [Streptomyces sp. NPDC000410]|uniref:hypothetical protein n=1 Tax=Streptomyces sp. NPDC000410 TaxID=3154254 RepID=UPI00332CE399